MKKWIHLLFIVAATFNSASANNITVSNVSLTGRNTSAGVNSTANYTLVQFDISWENSWRTSSVPYNFDAAWVFVKYRVGGGAWGHATLNYTGHAVPTGGAVTPATDGTGAFIYRDADGTGTFSEAGVQLRWNYGANGLADNSMVEIKVFAVEMVYVPTGAFALGSGGTEPEAFYKYPTTINTYPVSSEGAITVGTAIDNLYYGNVSGYAGDQIGPIPAAFPKGYAAFYCMKYEISQQGYVDFLNTLTYTQQVARTVNVPTSVAGTGALVTGNGYRNGIDIMTPGVSSTTPAVYACNLNGNTIYGESDDAQNIACNYLNWTDVAAYLDWSGLRPMTELEYEKACRGTLTAVANEYAWGTTGIAGSIYTLNNGGTENEVIATNYSTTVGNAAYHTTTPASGINGPVRVGIFAGASGNTGRVTAGATYYGIMEMSGNVYERPVTVGNATGRLFTGSQGNGALDATGNADVSTWPGTDAGGAGYRGGNWNVSATAMSVSDRNMGTFTYNGRGFNTGGRGIRLAPSDNPTTDPLLAPVAGGTFTAGTILTTTSSFKMGKYEVTHELWTAVRTWALTHGYTDLVAGQNGSDPVGTSNPVTQVSWYDVVKWCNARSEKDGLTPVYYTRSAQDTVYRTGQIDINIDAVKWTANGYRLPTEAEWEFAAKGGTLAQQPAPYTYSGSNTIDSVAWYSVNSGTTTHRVGTKAANELGIFDMSGNAFEWCWDWYGSTYPSGGTTDPKGPSTTQTYRLVRGGSFNALENYCRVVVRDYYFYHPTYRSYRLGFRCVQY